MVTIGVLSSERGGFGKLAFWERLDLVSRFGIAAAVFSIAGALLLGFWVSHKIEESAVRTRASTSARHFGYALSPYLQDLANSPDISAENVAQLEPVIDQLLRRMRIFSVKIWSRDGVVVYSNNPDLIGHQFETDIAQQRAWQGRAVAEFEALESPESTWENQAGIPMLEIYVPIYAEDGETVIALAEFYEIAVNLKRALDKAKRQSWVVTLLVSGSVLAAVISIVAEGGRTIDAQRLQLTEKLDLLSGSLHQQRYLHDRMTYVMKELIEENEKFIRTIGSELHDGPAQLISLALLQMDQDVGGADGNDQARATLSEAMQEIRAISAGLLLPAFDRIELGECLTAMVRQHEHRTRSTVDCHLGELPAGVPAFVKICLCRFVQEGLNNAYNHAGGKGQAVTVDYSEPVLRLEVSDQGPGISPSVFDAGSTRFGLAGLRNRIESIGGQLEIRGVAGVGTRLLATVNTDWGKRYG